jgi:hypothetical protein
MHCAQALAARQRVKNKMQTEIPKGVFFCVVPAAAAQYEVGKGYYVQAIPKQKNILQVSCLKGVDTNELCRRIWTSFRFYPSSLCTVDHHSF